MTYQSIQKILELLLHMGILLCQVEALGSLGHSDITQRAIDTFQTTGSYDFKQVLLDNMEFVMAGSTFPDWGYLCQTSSADVAHWTPFIDAFANYIDENYAPNTQKYKELISFLFGVHSHAYSDIEWHYGQRFTNYSLTQGYLHSMAQGASDCNGEWVDSKRLIDCHRIGDVGADFYISGRGDTSFIVHNWQIPVDDISKVYKRLGYTESSLAIASCNAAQFVGSILGEYFGGYLTFFLENHSAFLTEELDLWFNGGLEDMASNVGLSWTELSKKLEASTMPNDTGNGTKFGCTVFGVDFLVKTKNNYSEMIGFSEKTLDHGKVYEFAFDPTVIESNKDAIIVALLAEYGVTMNEDSIFDAASFNLKSTQTELNGQVSHSYFGKSIAIGDFNGDGKEEFFIGSPGYHELGNPELGAVYFSSVSDSIADSFDASQPYLTGPQKLSRFGFALAAVDLNHDGYDDLIVSAPSYGSHSFTNLTIDYAQFHTNYSGRLFGYLGSANGIQQSQDPDFVIRRETEDDPFYNMGINLRVSDCNGDGWDDLIILSPFGSIVATQQEQTGHIEVFYNMDKLKSAQGTLLLDDADISLASSTNYTWFGFDAVCSSDKTLFVGSPGSRTTTGDFASGAVFAYDTTTMKQKYVLRSDEPQSKFGQSLDYNAKQQLLAIGAPTRKETLTYGVGTVYIYDVTQSKLNFDQYQARIYSNERAGRFGKKILFVNDTLVVAAPSLSTPFSFKVPNDQGKIYVFREAQALSGDNSAIKAFEQYSTGQAGCRHGESLAYSLQAETLLMGSPFCSNNDTRLAGRVYFLELSYSELLSKFLQALNSGLIFVTVGILLIT